MITDGNRFGELLFRTVVGADGDGGSSVFEVELGSGCLSGPLHVHDREDAISYVLDGCITYQVGDVTETACAGQRVELPRGVRHTFWNPGTRAARAVDVVVPGGLERYYTLLADIAGAADAFEQLGALEDDFGIHMDWESVEWLSARYDLRMAASSPSVS